jgi:hypothetical protein
MRGEGGTCVLWREHPQIKGYDHRPIWGGRPGLDRAAAQFIGCAWRARSGSPDLDGFPSPPRSDRGLGCGAAPAHLTWIGLLPDQGSRSRTSSADEEARAFPLASGSLACRRARLLALSRPRPRRAVIRALLRRPRSRRRACGARRVGRAHGRVARQRRAGDDRARHLERSQIAGTPVLSFAHHISPASRNGRVAPIFVEKGV